MATATLAARSRRRPQLSSLRWLRRVAWTLALVGLAVWLGWLLAQPFRHPRTHLVLLAGDVVRVDPSPGAIPSDYVVEDFRTLLGLEGVLHRGVLGGGRPLVLGSLSQPDEMQHLGQTLNGLVSGSRDVLLVYVAAHGVYEDGDAWLVTAGGGTTRSNRYPLRKLLVQLRDCPAAAKLLILDAGRIDYDPLRGVLANDFPVLVEEQVQQLGDPSLWVLCSHRAGQRSHLSPSLRRSVFSHFVSEGLHGAADASGDRSIDLEELTRFVALGVEAWVEQTTGGTARQTPFLVWGGGDVDTGFPVLAAVPSEPTDEPEETADLPPSPQDGPRVRSHAEQQLTAEGRREVDSMIVRGLSRATPANRVGQYLEDRARDTASKALGSAPRIPGVSKDAPPKAEAKPSAEKEKATAPKDAKTAETPSAAAAEPATPATPAKTDAEKVDATAAIPALSPAEIEALLARAWQLRDSLAATSSPNARPLDHAPHLWRLIEERLLSLDRRWRTGFVQNPSDVAAPLGEIVATLEALAGFQPAESLPAGSLAKRIAESRPGRALAMSNPPSLAMAERIAREGGTPLPPALATLAGKLDETIAGGTRADLEKLAAELPPESDRLSELRLVRRLAARPELDWRLVQLLLETTRLAEQAAGSLVATQWALDDVARGDQLRIAAERDLLAAGSVQREPMIARLTAARGAYLQAIDERASVQAAERLAHDLWHRLPHFLAWHAAARNSPQMGPATEDLSRLLAALAAVDRALYEPAEGDIAALREATAQLTAARLAVERQLDPLAIEQLIAPPYAPGEAWQIELLLETPLPTAAMRAALAAAQPVVDAELTSAIEPAANESTALAAEASAGLREPWFADRAELQREQWQAALHGLPTNDAADLVETGADSPQGTDADQRDRFGSAVQELLLGLPARIRAGVADERDLSNRVARGSRLVRLAGWDRALRLVDARLAPLLADFDTAMPLSESRAYDLLAWQLARGMHAAEDAPPEDAAYFARVADAYRASAAAIPNQPLLAAPATAPVELSGSERIALTYDVERRGEFVVRNNSASRVRVWLVVDFDERALKVESGSTRTVYTWADLALGEGAATPGSAALSASLAERRASLELAPGQAERVPLRVERLPAASHGAQLVVRAIAEQQIARHDVTVELPAPEVLQLTLTNPPTTWTALPGGVTLHPFPNRTSAFGVQLASLDGRERKVDVEVYPLASPPDEGIPAAPLLSADAARLRSSLDLGPVVAASRGVVLSTTGQPARITLAPPEPMMPPPAPAPAADGSGAAAADAKPAAAAPPPSDKPQPIPLAEGLLVVVTDLADQRQAFKWLEIAPQRAERYVRARVRYRAARQQIEIVVTPVDPALLPPDGVRIHGEIIETLPPTAERLLDAVLRPGQAEATMHVEAPAVAGRHVTLQLTIDDYPRALFYRVPTSGETLDVPEDLDRLAVRIARLPEGTIYKPPIAAIPVQIEIDAPASSLSNPPLFVEVGIDRNQDRELTGDETVSLTADRRVEASLVGLDEKSGALLIDARVSDFAIDVPALGLGSGRAGVLARVALGEREAWSAPVEIAIDDQPPSVSSLELRPDRVVLTGAELLVSALADDGNLSGVAKFEAMFDLDRTGTFGPMAKTALGALGDDGRWAAKVPTAGLASGSYNVLVRAIDRAGNAGPPARATVRVMTKEEADAAAKVNNSADISGVVVYGAAPQNGITVTLHPEGAAPPPAGAKAGAAAPPPLARATTDSQGRFKFSQVAPGKYVVLAEGIVRNKKRRIEEPVAFEKPQDLAPLSLKLP